MKYYAQYESIPQFYTFDEIDRSKLDAGRIAQHIWDEDMGERKKTEYMDSLWESGDDNMLRLFFGRKLYFLNQINIELMKLSHPDIYDDENNILFQVDHIIPMNAGGKSTLDNLQILCRQCNGQKGDKS